MYDEKKEWDNVRIRNLWISIARGLKAEEWDSDRTFSESELKQVFLFKASDLAYYADTFFECSGKMYILSEKEKKYMNKILHANRMAMDFLRDADAKFVAEFGSFHDEYENDSYGDFYHSRYQKAEQSVAELLPVLRCIICKKSHIIDSVTLPGDSNGEGEINFVSLNLTPWWFSHHRKCPKTQYL